MVWRPRIVDIDPQHSPIKAEPLPTLSGRWRMPASFSISMPAVIDDTGATRAGLENMMREARRSLS